MIKSPEKDNLFSCFYNNTIDETMQMWYNKYKEKIRKNRKNKKEGMQL